MKGLSERSLRRREVAGFTLIELMMTIIIFAIIASIAYPNYVNYVRKSHRTSAKTALLAVASREERYFSTNNVYATSLTMLGYSTTGIDVPSGGSPYYHLTLFATSTTHYAIKAIPIGTQAQDTACGTFTLNSLGEKGTTGTSTGCWQ